MRARLKNSNFDETTGVSTVTISTPYGDFTGTSKLHEDDEHHVSKFAGCRFAEMKAYIKAEKAKLRELYLKRKWLCEISNGFSPFTHDYVFKHLVKIERGLDKEIAALTEEIRSHEQGLLSAIKERDKAIISLQAELTKEKDDNEQ